MGGQGYGDSAEAHVGVGAVFEDADPDGADAEDFFVAVGEGGFYMSDGFHSRFVGNVGGHLGR